MAHGTDRCFLVERYVPSLRPERVGEAVARLEASPDVDAVHLLTLLIPAEETCLSVFRAVDPSSVLRANERAGFTVDRVVEVQLFRGDPTALELGSRCSTVGRRRRRSAPVLADG